MQLGIFFNGKNYRDVYEINSDEDLTQDQRSLLISLLAE